MSLGRTQHRLRIFAFKTCLHRARTRIPPLCSVWTNALRVFPRRQRFHVVCCYAKCSKGGLSRRFGSAYLRFGCPLKPTFPLVLCGQNSLCATRRFRRTKSTQRAGGKINVATIKCRKTVVFIRRFVTVCTPCGYTPAARYYARQLLVCHRRQQDP